MYIRTQISERKYTLWPRNIEVSDYCDRLTLHYCSLLFQATWKEFNTSHCFSHAEWPIYSFIPRSSPSFLSLGVRLNGRGPGTFSEVSDVMGRKTVERL